MVVVAAASMDHRPRLVKIVLQYIIAVIGVIRVVRANRVYIYMYICMCWLDLRPRLLMMLSY